MQPKSFARKSTLTLFLKRFREHDMARKTRRWDAADTLKTKRDIAAYLDAVLADGDPDLLKVALGDVARSKGMTEIAQATGLGRANLYKALSPDGKIFFIYDPDNHIPDTLPLERHLRASRSYEGKVLRCHPVIKP